MPLVRQMFPSKFLQPEDLPPGGMTAVTIAKVVALQAVYNPQTDQLETTWLIRFAEFQKPCKLKSGLARLIGEVLGDDETNNWVGQRIHIHPGTIEAWGKQIPVICVAPTRPGPASPQLGGGKNAQVAARPAINQSRVIGSAGASRFLEVCAEFQVAMPAFLAWLMERDVEMHRACVGIPIERLPAASMTAMKAWFDELKEARDRPSQQVGSPVSGEVVDRRTGEVKTVPAGTLAQPDTKNIGLPAAEEEIPF